MKTLFKILAFAALGIGAILVLLFAFHVIGSLLSALIPLAILAAIGFVIWKVVSAGKAPGASVIEKKEPEAIAPPKPAMSAEEAARHFDELKKAQQKS